MTVICLHQLRFWVTVTWTITKTLVIWCSDKTQQATILLTNRVNYGWSRRKISRNKSTKKLKLNKDNKVWREKKNLKDWTNTKRWIQSLNFKPMRNWEKDSKSIKKNLSCSESSKQVFEVSANVQLLTFKLTNHTVLRRWNYRRTIRMATMWCSSTKNI